ncbi:MAG: transposase [Candidatus Shapirobacteria bacterium]|jgi:REP element-mobilizing transposase RayT
MENKRHTIRLYHRNYSRPGYYFVTIDTFKHEFIFGDIKDNIFISNTVGTIIDKWINYLPTRYPEIYIDCYQLMPNHMHLIILIKGNFFGKTICVRANYDSPTHNHRQLLPQVIGYFKMNTAKEIMGKSLLKTEKVWLRNYYEHIIRNKKELLAYRYYVKNNPKNWFFNK